MEEDKIEVADMYLAAACISYGMELVGVDRTENRKQKFLFNPKIKVIYTLNNETVTLKDNPSFAELETHFIARSLMYTPSYPDALKRVKSALHSV